MPTVTEEGRRVVEHRHEEYLCHETTWRWLQDSLEGGQEYRDATYGEERRSGRWNTGDRDNDGQYIWRSYSHRRFRQNLIRHPSEWPQPYGQGDAGEQWGEESSADEYEFRRQITPVPDFVAEGIHQHLARIYTHEVDRKPPPGPLGARLEAWWADVDGSGQDMDMWMHEVIAPLFLVLGQLDLAFDRPPAPTGVTPRSRADVARLGLDRCVASYILPDNLTDWGLRPDKDYEWCVVRERRGGEPVFRIWTDTGWTLYNQRGEQIGPDGTHPYGCVPIFRSFDTRKPRRDHVGSSRYEVVAEIQKAYYNAHSELRLTNSLAAHPQLSGPEKLVQGQTVPLGPGNVLPKVRDAVGQYATWEWVAAPVGPAEKLMEDMQHLRDAADRANCLTKPAGAKGTTGQTVAQSGISKQIDQGSLNDLLSSIAKSLQRLEKDAAKMALTVLNGGPVDKAVLDAIEIKYPMEFDLHTADEFATYVGEYQSLLAGVEPRLPLLMGQFYSKLTRLGLPGLDDPIFTDLDTEMTDYLAAEQEQAARRAEAVPILPPTVPPQPPGGLPAADGVPQSAAA